jgi:hypothetical protein
VLLLTLMGCERKDPQPYELVNAGNGLLYRVNKSSGEVSVIAGSQLTKLEEWTGPKKEEPKKSYVANWLAQTNSALGNLVLELKTNWREGKMYYILRLSPYAGRIEAELKKSPMTARFDLNFYDSEGFQVLTIPVQLAETSRTVDSDGKFSSVRVNSTVQCSAEMYESIKGWLASWVGFSDKEP